MVNVIFQVTYFAFSSLSMIMIDNGPEETTYIEQVVGLHVDMITVNGWCAGGKGRG